MSSHFTTITTTTTTMNNTYRGLRRVSSLVTTHCRYLSKLPARAATVAKFDFPLATHTSNQVDLDLERLVGDKVLVTLNGHLHKKPRMMTTKGFAELRDANGEVVQIVADPQGGEWLVNELGTSGAEDSVSVTGWVKRKKERIDPVEQKVDPAERKVSPRTHKSDLRTLSTLGPETPRLWELHLTNYQILNSSNLSSARLDKLKHSSPQDLPPQFRYLQLRTKFYQNALRTRSNVSTLIRNTLINNHNFTEIETPLLFKSTPEGAREFLVPTRTAGKFYALPQSPQQYKQILMSSGFTRYFQLAKCFRDEDLRADRQPEFTQVDLEMSFISNSDQVCVVVEDIIHNVWNKVGGLPTYRVNEHDFLEKIEFDGVSTNHRFNKLKYIDALANYGIDKPDLRSNLKFIDLSKYFSSTKDSEFPVVEACVLKGVFDPAQKYRVPHTLTDAINYTKRKPIVLAIKSLDDASNWYTKFVEKGVFTQNLFDPKELEQALSLAPGDILAFSTRSHLPYENPTPLGKFRQQSLAEFPNKWNRPIQDGSGTLTTDYDREKVFVGAWVVDFPLFNPIDVSDASEEFPRYDKSQFESTHHPFTMAKTEDYELLATDPLKVHGEHYDLVINGVEVGGGSRRIHDPELQQYVFENILRVDNYQAKFGHLLQALSMGCPPHAGLALGFDRLCAMLIGSASIRDVIAFPKNQSGVDPVVESPTEVSEKTLEGYYIKSTGRIE